MRGNISGFIVAIVSSVLIGIIIMEYMLNSVKDIVGNNTVALSHINQITNIAYISLFFVAFIGFVVSARYILDVIGGRPEGGM